MSNLWVESKCLKNIRQDSVYKKQNKTEQKQNKNENKETKKQKANKQQKKNVNMNVEWMGFPNLLAQNKPWRVDVKINQSCSSTSSKRADSMDYISPIIPVSQYLHKDHKCKFLLVGHHWCVHVLESTGECRLWVLFLFHQKFPACFARLS